MPITQILDEFDEKFPTHGFGNIQEDGFHSHLIKSFLRSSLISLLEEDVRRMEKVDCQHGESCYCITALSQEIAYKNNQIEELRK